MLLATLELGMLERQNNKDIIIFILLKENYHNNRCVQLNQDIIPILVLVYLIINTMSALVLACFKQATILASIHTGK